MKPRPFDYVRAENVVDALDGLARHGENSRIIAGGQSLMAMLNLRLVDPGVLIDIGRIGELKRIERKAGWVEIGAGVTQNEVLAWPHLREYLPLLALALPFVGHFQTRNRGTICGSVAHADPSSEIPLVLAALSGEVVLRSQRKTRTVAVADFQTGMLSTARRPDELIVAVRMPEHGHTGCAFREVARRHGDFAIVALAAIAERDGMVRLAVGGVADRPLVHRFVKGECCVPEALVATVDEIAWRAGGYDDVHATARYRRDLIRRLAPLVIEEALSCVA